MAWIEQELESRKKLDVTTERATLLDQVKKETLPTIAAEAANGQKAFDPIKFQPVHSPGIFEAEFGVKNGDLVFHFWPWGFHLAEKRGQPRPSFKNRFYEEVKAVFTDEFGSGSLVVDEDRDMGAVFAKVTGGGQKQFWFKLSEQAMTKLHKAMGGD